jgi:hypothetical protein
VRLVPPAAGALGAVIAFTAHHVIASPLDPERLVDRLHGQEVHLPTDPRFLAWLADQVGGSSSEDTIDVVLARRGLDSTAELRMEAPIEEMLDDPRVAFAAATRRELRVLRSQNGAAVAVLGQGLAGRLELAIELDPNVQGSERTDQLLSIALAEVGSGQSVLAQVSAGNSAALRAALRRGFTPICAEYLIR